MHALVSCWHKAVDVDGDYVEKYEAYSESKYRFAVKKKSSKVSYKILLLSDSTFFKLFFHIFAAIIEACHPGTSLGAVRGDNHLAPNQGCKGGGPFVPT